MALTSAQLVTLKADIAANTNTTTTYPGVQIKDLNLLNGDHADAIAKWYNTTASPDFVVWRSNVPISEVGKSFNGTELAGLTTGNQTRLQTLALYFADGVNPSLADVRSFFDDVFSGAGGTTTRANLAVTWKRLANRVEKVLASGTGTTQSPATMGFEGTITYQDLHA